MGVVKRVVTLVFDEDDTDEVAEPVGPIFLTREQTMQIMLRLPMGWSGADPRQPLPLFRH